MNSPEFIQHYLNLHKFIWIYLNLPVFFSEFTWIYLNFLEFTTWIHFGSLWFTSVHLSSLSLPWVHLGSPRLIRVDIREWHIHRYIDRDIFPKPKDPSDLITVQVLIQNMKNKAFKIFLLLQNRNKKVCKKKIHKVNKQTNNKHMDIWSVSFIIRRGGHYLALLCILFEI